MIQELYCYFDAEKNICRCAAKKGDHEFCKRHFPTSNSRPCIHLRPDEGNRCDNAYAQFEAYAASIKPQKEKSDG